MCDDINRLLRDAEKWKDSGLLMPACAPAVLALAARLVEAEALLRECRHFVKALCDHDDATCGCYQHIVLRGIDAFLTPDSASADCKKCGYPMVNHPRIGCATDQPNERVK